MSLYEFKISTGREGFYNITSEARQAVSDSGITEGICVVYCPHTTAAITINENADPDVIPDIFFGLNQAFPNHDNFRHVEGNSAAHIKSSCFGVSETIIVAGGKLLLGIWQGVYFCEFDGPRNRKFYVKVI